MSERSYLFVPGNRPERFEKARASGADAVIFDLEDAVQPQEKQGARETVRAHLDAVRPAFVRINAADTVWFANDAVAIASRDRGPHSPFTRDMVRRLIRFYRAAGFRDRAAECERQLSTLYTLAASTR